METKLGREEVNCRITTAYSFVFAVETVIVVDSVDPVAGKNGMGISAIGPVNSTKDDPKVVEDHVIIVKVADLRPFDGPKSPIPKQTLAPCSVVGIIDFNVGIFSER